MRNLVLILVCCLLPLSSFAQGNEEDPTLQIVFSHLPAIQDEETKTIVAEYTKLAKAFWVEKKCERLAGNFKKEFVDNLAQITGVVRARFQTEFKVDQVQAQKYAEIPQMWALNEVSAKQIQCSEELNDTMVLAVVQSRDFLKKWK